MDINKYNPKNKISNKHLLTLKDYSTDEIFEILHLAKKLKIKQKAGEKQNYLNGKTVALIFAKSSTRTRVSFEIGIKQLGGNPLFLSSNDIQLGRGETIHDTIKVLCRYYIDAIMIRTFKQEDLEELAKHGNIPIINGLTDLVHPCQVLADLLTIWEHKGKLAGLKVAYLGDGNNMANSLMIGCAKCGMDISIGTPKGFEPDKDITEYCLQFGKVTITNNPIDAIKNADVVITDVFFSMGQEVSKEKYDNLMKFQINSELLNYAKKDFIFMHCLPAHRGEEVTSEIIDGNQSVIFDEAENRLHAQKAVMALLIK